VLSLFSGPEIKDIGQLRGKLLAALAAQEVYAHAKRASLAHPGVEPTYMLGSGWRTLEIVDLLEQDLEVPVIHPVAARLWALQKRLRVRQPRTGFGRLLREMP
jgi:maleate cis-trans isomerase